MHVFANLVTYILLLTCSFPINSLIPCIHLFLKSYNNTASLIFVDVFEIYYTLFHHIDFFANFFLIKLIYITWWIEINYNFVCYVFMYTDAFEVPTRPVEKPFRCSIADIFKGTFIQRNYIM